MMRGAAVLVHGSWGLPDDWRWVREPLEAAGVEVIAVDLPSHRSAEPGFAEDAAAVREAIRGAAQPVVGVGWSYGAAVLAEAATDGLPIRRLVFVSSIPGQDTEEDHADISWIEANPHIELLADGRFRLESDWFLDEEDGATLPDEVRTQLRGTGRRWSNLHTERPLTHQEWTAVPATVVYGADDPLLGANEKERNAARFEDVRIIEGDHFVPFRSPELLVGVVLEALGSPGAGS